MAKKTISFFPNLSIKKRLPLLIGGLLLVIILIFTWSSYYSLRSATLNIGYQRTQNLSKQLSELLGKLNSKILFKAEYILQK